jgi:hypothetical protein
MPLLQPGRKRRTEPLYMRVVFWLWVLVGFIVLVLIVAPLVA